MATKLGIDYWRLWTSAGLSDLADGIVKLALPLVAIEVTRSPALVAGLTFAFTLPWLLFALPAGALVDRMDRRRVMLGANIVRATLLTVLVLAVVLHAGSIWALYVVALSVGTAETLYDTAAQSILPQIVAREQLSKANGRLYAAELGASQFVGPPLGGLLVAAGAVAAFVTPTALWLAAVGALLSVRGRFRLPRTEPTTLRADIAEGLRYLARHRLLRRLATMVGIFNFTGNATSAILVLYAVGPTSAMRLSTSAYGVLLTAIAVGSLLGSFLTERIERRIGRARSLLLSIVGNLAIAAVPAVTANPYAIGGAFLLGGFGIMLWNSITVSLRQRITPDRLLGRLNSCYRLLAWGTMPVGAAIGGLLAQLFGLRAVFVVMTCVTLVSVLGMRIVTDRAMDAAEREHDAITTPSR
ncbi:MAG TPA: MFS transporter [Pseudonocardiaceae bacterium]|nr:MFS transporter [Pseudonocardiaceae bacterium]